MCLIWALASMLYGYPLLALFFFLAWLILE